METNRTYSKVAAIFFLVLLFGFTAISFVFPDRAFSENENRELATMPELSVDGIFSGEFMKDYESYITDQFFCRDKWIQLKTATEMALNKQDINGVYLGKDGYLIERHEDTKIDYEMLEKTKNYLKTFVDKFSGRLNVKVMIVPTASEILTDKLPPFATGFDQNGFIDDIYASIPEDTVLDIRDTLKEHADEYIYYKTDHHWTSLGAFYAYQEFAGANGFEVPKLEDIKQTVVSEDFLGTVHSKLNTEISRDTMTTVTLPNTPTSIKMTVDMTKTFDTLYNDEYLGKKDKYSYYLDGNHGLTEIVSNSEGKGTLLIIKDSYSHCFAPMTLGNYEKVYLVDFRYFNMSITQFIQQYRVTDVLVLYNAVTLATDTKTSGFAR